MRADDLAVPIITDFQSVLGEASLASSRPPPQILYHYTGLDGAMKIIESDAAVDNARWCADFSFAHGEQCVITHVVTVES